MQDDHRDVEYRLEKMQRPDQDTLKAMVLLEGDKRMEKILKWFDNSYRQIMKKELGERVEFNAGRAAELFDILDTLENAREILKEHDGH